MRTYNCLIFGKDHTSIMTVSDHFQTVEFGDSGYVEKNIRKKCSGYHLIEDSQVHKREVDRLFLAPGTLHFSSFDDFKKWFDLWEPTY